MGAMTWQSALLAHPTQRFDALHTGLAPEQSALVRHATHRLETVSHWGVVAAVQSLFTRQPTHEPAFMPDVAHAGPPGLPVQSALVAQAPHVCVAVLHTGVLPLQSVLNSQWTHVPVGKSQTFAPPVHCDAFVEVHWPQAPQTSQAGVEGEAVQSASDPQALHAPALHTGVSPPQSAPDRHCVQALVAGLHRGVAGGQLASATQATHRPRSALPAVRSHSGVVPPQSAFDEQARQVSVPLSQIGVAPAQFAFVRQPTQVLTGTSHTGAAAPHAVAFVAEQIAQMPEAAQAGVAPPHAESPSQEHGIPSVLSSSS